MTQLIFRYSSIYDRMIASWLGKKWKKEYAKKGFKYLKRIQKEWNKINLSKPIDSILSLKS